jgi:dihydrofolate reductase
MGRAQRQCPALYNHAARRALRRIGGAGAVCAGAAGVSAIRAIGDQESTIISGNVAETITKLKHQPGKDIIIDGSVTLVQSLMGTDLIDEYRFLVQPFIMGRGRRFFPDGTLPTKLRLVESKALSFGSLVLVYRPANK